MAKSKLFPSAQPAQQSLSDLAVRANAFQALKDGASPLIELSNHLIKLPGWSPHPAFAPSPQPSTPKPDTHHDDESEDQPSKKVKGADSYISHIVNYIRNIDMKSKPKKELSQIYEDLHAAGTDTATATTPAVTTAKAAFNKDAYDPNTTAFASNNSSSIAGDNTAFAGDDIDLGPDENPFTDDIDIEYIPTTPTRFGAGCVIPVTESLASALQRRLSEQEDDLVTRRITEIRSSMNPSSGGHYQEVFAGTVGREALKPFPIGGAVKPVPKGSLGLLDSNGEVPVEVEVEDWEKDIDGEEKDGQEIFGEERDDIDSLADLDSLDGLDAPHALSEPGDPSNPNLHNDKDDPESTEVVVSQIPIIMIQPPEEEFRVMFRWDGALDMYRGGIGTCLDLEMDTF